MCETNNLTRLIVEQTADALIYADRSGVIQLWNQACVGIFGYSQAEAVGQSLDIIIPEHLRAPHWRGFNAAMESGELKLSGKPTLTKALCKNGDKIYAELTFALIKDENGEVLGSVSMARDATARIEKERAALTKK